MSPLHDESCATEVWLYSLCLMVPLNIDLIRQALPERRIEYFMSVDSTMRAAAVLERGAVAVAEEQTAGRGRFGRNWHSEPGTGIYCSVVLAPGPVLTLALGLAARDAIFHATGIACDLRWPNDLMLGGRKVAGILTQLEAGNAVAGIGINVGQSTFPPELETEATSLLRAGYAGGRDAILLALLLEIDRYAALEKREILVRFTEASSYAQGLRVTVEQPSGAICGVTAGLNEDGFLKLRKDDGTETLILAGGVRAASA